MSTPQSTTLTVFTGDALTHIGQIANGHAAQNAFARFLQGKATNTRLTHGAGLRRFADYLEVIGDAGGIDIAAPMRAFGEALYAGQLDQLDPTAWRGVTWGLVESFREWLITQGDAIATINSRLSTVKVYSKIAAKAGVIPPEERAMIREVGGFTHKEGVHVDDKRPGKTRRGLKKAQNVPITVKQAKALKDQPDTPQGRRDAVLMCLLLDHGLRCGEVARLQVTDFDLKAGQLVFYRPKVDLIDTHNLSADTLRALHAWIDSGDAGAIGPLLRGSRKGGTLTHAGMGESSITGRVKALGERVGLVGLSAHDCRHYWATFWAGKVDVLRLQEAGGWASLAMPRRYVARSKIANEGMT